MFGFVAGVMLQTAAAAPPAAPPDSLPSPQVRVRVTPDTVLVGKPFVVTIRVRVPSNAIIQFPAVPERGALIDTAGPVVRRDTIVGDSMESVATYPMAAWNIGKQDIVLGDLIVETPDGPVQLSYGAPKIFVKTVLPKDSAKHVPKAPRPPFPKYFDLMGALRRWLVPLLLLLAAILMAVLGRRIWRRRHAVAEDQDTRSWAEREFQRIEALRLLEQGESARHAILMADVVRGYLVRQFGTARASSTTSELVRALRNEPMVPVDRIDALYARVDLLKFAAASTDVLDAQNTGTESRAIVQGVEDARTQAARAAVARTAADTKSSRNRSSPRGPKA